jgi:hypothetical protein
LHFSKKKKKKKKISLPKKTRWYNNMVELKNSGKT